MTQKNILITGIGGPTTRGIAKALKKFACHDSYRVVGVDSNPFAIGLYITNYVDASYTVPPVSSHEYWKAIKKIVEEQKIDLALVQPEVEVEAWSLYGQTHSLPCPTLLPSLEFVRAVRDKARLFEMLTETDLIPKSVSFHRDQINDLSNILPFPFWVRARKGAGGLGAFKVTKLIELEAWLLIQPHIELFTASEFLPGRNIACQMFYFNGELMRAACAERVEYFRAETVPSGVSGLTCLGRVTNDPISFDISIRCINELYKQLGQKPHGFVTVDLKEDVLGNPKVTEINVRHISFTIAFAEAGVNFAEDMVQAVLGKPENVSKEGLHTFDEDWIFVRHVDSEMVVMRESAVMPSYSV